MKNEYDVIIVGGGAAGLSLAITLGSAQEHFEWAQSKKVLLIDRGASDLRAACLKNAPGVSVGMNGSELLKELWGQLSQYPSIEVLQNSEVSKLAEDESTEGYLVSTENGEYVGSIVILATGLHQAGIESSLLDVETHTAVARDGMVKFKNVDGEVRKNLYAVGLAKGLQTMYAIAAGDGVAMASKLLWEWSGKPAVPHDVVKKG